MLILEKLTGLHPQASGDINLHISSGERVAVLGPSGAGKSTLLNLIAGFRVPAGGRILLNNHNHTETAPSRRPVSMLFQENNLFPHLTLAQNIGLGLHPGLKLSAIQQQQLQQIVSQVGLSESLNCLPAQLSGGQRQRAALARCLLRCQPILLLDEPFSALDPVLHEEMLCLLEQICLQRCLTVLMVSHSLTDALRVAKRTLLIVSGDIVYDGPTQALVDGTVPQAAILGVKLFSAAP